MDTVYSHKLMLNDKIFNSNILAPFNFIEGNINQDLTFEATSPISCHWFLSIPVVNRKLLVLFSGGIERDQSHDELSPIFDQKKLFSLVTDDKIVFLKENYVNHYFGYTNNLVALLVAVNFTGD